MLLAMFLLTKMKSTMEYTLSYDVSKMIDDVSTMFYDVSTCSKMSLLCCL